MYVSAANFIFPTARASAARGQAGEEVGERGLGQKTQEAGPEQPWDPLPPHFRKEEGRHRQGTGSTWGTGEQQAFTRRGSEDVRFQPVGLLLSELSLFPLLGLDICSSFCQDRPFFGSSNDKHVL